MKIRRNPKKSIKSSAMHHRVIRASKDPDKEYVELIKQSIQQFYDMNYGDDADFSDMKNVSMLINYDRHSDRVLSEVVADLMNYQIVYKEGNKRKVVKKFSDAKDMLDYMQAADLDDYMDMSVYIDSSTDIRCAKSLNMKAGLGHHSDWILRGYKFDGEDVTTLRIDFQDNVKQAVTDMFADPDIDTIDVYRIDTEQDTTGVFEDETYFNTFTRDDINASTTVNADLQLNRKPERKQKYNWGKNPIIDLDGYVQDIADGVVEKYPDLEYEISDEAITFTKDGAVIYVQPIDEIVPEKDDLDQDIDDLSDAIQHEQESSDWYNQDWESDEDDPDYATRNVTL